MTPEDRQEILKKFKVEDVPFRKKGVFVWKNVEITHVTWDMDHHVIDAENIFQASMRGMKEAALFLQDGDIFKTKVLIDGQSKLRWDVVCPWDETTIVKGDVKSSLIGLAAIIAKEKRDAYMKSMHEIYPHYGFDTNMGYPTPFHRKAIEEHGPCPIHRKSFGKVKEFIPTP